MRGIRVAKPGLLTTVQDGGRWGYQALGVPVAGPMDSRAHRAANALAGNPSTAAALEITMIGPELRVEDEDLVLAVAGAEFDLQLDGQRVATNTAVTGRAGATLTFGQRRRGARAYLAVGGGIATPPILGSRSTHAVSRMGGLDGRAVRAGDCLTVGVQPERRAAASAIAPVAVSTAVPLPAGRARLRVLPGPDLDRFSRAALDALCSGAYSISPDSNRMGFRLTGPPLPHSRGADLISDATPLGTLQVPASEQPILLMADRQVTGGYPRIATVISADVGTAGQLAPGDTIEFALCNLSEAMAALIAEERALMAIEARR